MDVVALGLAKADAAKKYSPIYAGGPPLTNPAGLARWRAAYADSLFSPAVITVWGDSVPWGVGSDGNGAQIGPLDEPQQTLYRTNAWPRQLGTLFGNSVRGWAGASPLWDYATLSGSPTTSSGDGPFGAYAPGTAGVRLSGDVQRVTYDATKLGAFTEIDVWCHGDPNVSSGTTPAIYIDGVLKNTPAAVPTNVPLVKTTITGLADTTHAVELRGVVTGVAYTIGVTVRRSSGVVINNISRPGATISDAAALGLTTAQQDRVKLSTIMAGTTKLLIVTFGINDQAAQIPLATYQAQLQDAITRQTAGGGCTLLLGSPPAVAPTGTLTEQQYRDTMQGLAQTNTHCAFLDIRSIWGTFAAGNALGLYANSGTVHPSRAGHGDIARMLYRVLTASRLA